MTTRLSPDAVKRSVHGGGEVALLDVRELAAHGDGHPLFACPCPFSRLEPLATTLVPRRSTPVILVDDGDGLAERAAARLEGAGYRAVRILDGGLPAWRAAGFGVYEGVHVPSKTLGEIWEREHRPLMVTAETLAAWAAASRPFVLFDVRPPEEFERATVPGADNAPNGELPHRLERLVGERDGPIVLTCAGRTRGIVGAVGMALAGVDRPVYALEDGTQGWTLAGYSLQPGRKANGLPPPDVARSRNRAARIAAAAAVPFVSMEQAVALAEDEDRTTYVFDLRTEVERAAAPVPGARAATGVQLVQSTDHWMAVRRARVLLLDDTGLRGALAAAALRRMGFDARVLQLSELQSERAPGFVAPSAWTMPSVASTPPLRAMELAARGDALVLDVRSWPDHVRERPAGSVWTQRAALSADVPAGALRLFVVGNDLECAALAVSDLIADGRSAALVEGGWQAWLAAGGPTERGGDVSAIRDPDRIWFAAGRHEGNREASLQYLAWERGLIARLDAAERLEFGCTQVPPSTSG